MSPLFPLSSTEIYGWNEMGVEEKRRNRVGSNMILPEDCVCEILSLTSPVDALRSCLVCSCFRSAAESDLVWERFLPPDYEEIVQRSSVPLNFSSKKQLFLSLCDPLLLDDGGKINPSIEQSFKLERQSGKKWYMLSARELSITWANNPIYWKWVSTTESRFSEAIVLRASNWLEIRCKIRTRMLTRSTMYGAFMILKKTRTTYGLELLPAETSVEVRNQKGPSLPLQIHSPALLLLPPPPLTITNPHFRPSFFSAPMEASALSRIGLAGLAVMGQNLALNVAEKGFPISVYNRTASKVDETVQRAANEGHLPLSGHYSPRDFVLSIQRPRSVVILVKAGAPVDQTIAALSDHMEAGDCIIDGGNEWYENTERRIQEVSQKGLLYLGMGVSGGEEGARKGPSLMPGGSFNAYTNIKDILEKVAAQVEDGPCVTYIGEGGSGNFVKMVHNGIEYGDMQLISEAYDVLKHVGGLSNDELAEIFAEWNKGELESFLIEITSDIFRVRDEYGEGELVDKILDKTGMKGTGKWTVQQAAELSVAAPTIAASLDCRYLSGLKEERENAAIALKEAGLKEEIVGFARGIDKKRLIDDVRQALYASKICSYAQGMNLLRAKSIEKGWNLNLGELARIWKGGCIIRAVFLDRIKKAYQRNSNLASLVVDPEFAKEMVQRQAAWRRVVGLAISAGISTPGMCASLAYFDTYRRARLPANLVQAQRDLFGAHTYERIDRPGAFHTEWTKLARKSNAGIGALN